MYQCYHGKYCLIDIIYMLRVRNDATLVKLTVPPEIQ